MINLTRVSAVRSDSWTTQIAPIAWQPSVTLRITVVARLARCSAAVDRTCFVSSAEQVLASVVSFPTLAQYHARQELPGTPALARQHQEWCGIRKGTQTLLDSGTARADLLHDHGVHAHTFWAR